MKYLKLFDDDNSPKKFRIDSPKLETPKVVGKIDLTKLDKPKSLDLDIDIPKDFEDEIIKKVNAYFKNYPKVNQSIYCDDRVESLLDLNKIGKVWEPINVRLTKPQARTLLDKKKFFRFDKKWNCYSMLSSSFAPKGLKTTLLVFYGPIKGESGHGDFFFNIIDNNYHVFTKHSLERYYQRKMGGTAKSLSGDEMKLVIKDFMTTYVQTEDTGEEVMGVFDSKTSESVLKINGGAFIGTYKKNALNWISINSTFYSDSMLKPRHLKMLSDR